MKVDFETVISGLEDRSGFVFTTHRFEHLDGPWHLFRAMYTPFPGGELELSMKVSAEDLVTKYAEFVEEIGDAMKEAASMAEKHSNET
jgi:hypothetical protein